MKVKEQTKSVRNQENSSRFSKLNNNKHLNYKLCALAKLEPKISTHKLPSPDKKDAKSSSDASSNSVSKSQPSINLRQISPPTFTSSTFTPSTLETDIVLVNVERARKIFQKGEKLYRMSKLEEAFYTFAVDEYAYYLFEHSPYYRAIKDSKNDKDRSNKNKSSKDKSSKDKSDKNKSELWLKIKDRLSRPNTVNPKIIHYILFKDKFEDMINLPGSYSSDKMDKIISSFEETMMKEKLDCSLAYYALGYDYLKSKINREKGLYYFIASAEKNFPPAQLEMGWYYLNCNLFGRAFYWCKKAMENGEKLAYYQLAICYLHQYSAIVYSEPGIEPGLRKSIDLALQLDFSSGQSLEHKQVLKNPKPYYEHVSNTNANSNSFSIKLVRPKDKIVLEKVKANLKLARRVCEEGYRKYNCMFCCRLLIDDDNFERYIYKIYNCRKRIKPYGSQIKRRASNITAIHNTEQKNSHYDSRQNCEEVKCEVMNNCDYYHSYGFYLAAGNHPDDLYHKNLENHWNKLSRFYEEYGEFIDFGEEYRKLSIAIAIAYSGDANAIAYSCAGVNIKKNEGIMDYELKHTSSVTCSQSSTRNYYDDNAVDIDNAADDDSAINADDENEKKNKNKNNKTRIEWIKYVLPFLIAKANSPFHLQVKSYQNNEFNATADEIMKFSPLPRVVVIICSDYLFALSYIYC